MKKILIISCIFPPEPVVSAQLSFDIADQLSLNHEVTVLSPKPSRPENFKFSNIEKKYNFKHIITDSYVSPKSKLFSRMKESLSFGKHCSNYINKNPDFDVIYFNSWPLFSQFYIIKTAKKNKIPSIVHIQDIYPESLINKLPFAKFLILNLLMPFDKYLLKNANKILCISENMFNILSETRKINKNKFVIVPNWQNEEAFINYQNKKSINKNSKEEFTFMYLGNNGPVAGVELLIEAFVDAKIPNSKLIIAGNGSKTEVCIELSKKLNATNIDFILVPEGKVPEIQDKADVMLLPVKKGAAMSSIPSKLPAYMFSKKPIIGSLDLKSDTAKAIIDSDCGIVVEPEKKEELTQAFIEISKWESQKLQEKGKNGFNFAIKNLSKKTNLQKVVDVILKES